MEILIFVQISFEMEKCLQYQEDNHSFYGSWKFLKEHLGLLKLVKSSPQTLHIKDQLLEFSGSFIISFSGVYISTHKYEVIEMEKAA